MRTEAPALMPVFRSRNQGRLLALLLPNPGIELTLSELARELGVPKTTVLQEVDRLVDAHILRDRHQGRNRLISGNPEHRLYAALTQLALLSFGPHHIVAEEFARVPGVDRVLIVGSWAARYEGHTGPPPDDIDVLVIGEDLNRTELLVAAERSEKRLGGEAARRPGQGKWLEVNPLSATQADWDDPQGSILRDLQSKPWIEVHPRKEHP